MKTYDWKKTGIKMAWVLGEIAVAGGLSYITGHNEFLFIAPILEGTLDYIKHRS